ITKWACNPCVILNESSDSIPWFRDIVGSVFTFVGRGQLLMASTFRGSGSTPFFTHYVAEKSGLFM
ncbi:unnamed protein product, partial [Trichogramma brassicae]